MQFKRVSVVGLAIASVICLCGFGFGGSDAAEKAQNVCVATNLTEAMACKDGQVLIIPFAGKTTDSDLFQSESFIRIMGALCDYSKHIEIVAGDGITCVVLKKPNAAEILSEKKTKR